MGCCAGLGRILIVVLNFIFIIVGLALTVVGALIMAGGDTLKKWLQPVIVKLEEALTSAGVNDVNISDINIKEFVGGLDLIILIIGIIFLVIAICGIIGACCKVKPLLIIYAVFVAVILLAQIAILIIIFAKRDLFDSTVKSGLKRTIKEEYRGANSSDVMSLTWNMVMTSRACCGADNSSDFQSATNWPRTFANYTLITPLACCKTFPTSDDASSFDCAVTPSTADSNYQNGCYDSLWKFVDENKALVIGVMAAILVLQLLLIIFVIIIVRAEKEKVGMV